MEHKDNGPVIIGAICGLLFAAFFMFKRYQADAMPAPSSEVAQVALQDTFAEPEEPPTASPLPVYDTQPAPETRSVYECLKDGLRVFSDSPCGDDARTRTISKVNSMDAPQPIYRPSPAQSPTASARALQETSDTQDRDCSPFEETLRRIDERMRHGYTSAEGEFWREQRRQAASGRDACIKENRLR